MQAGRAFVGSLILHAGVLALALRWMHHSEPRPGLAPAPEDRVEPREQTFEVAIVDVPDVPVTVVQVPDRRDAATPIPDAAAPGHGRTAATPSAIAMTTVPNAGAATTSGRDHEAGHDHGPGIGLMHMRGPDLRPAEGTLEAIAAGGKPLPGTPHESGRLEHAPGGRGVIHDRVTTVEVERDGTAHLHDEPDIDIHWTPPIHIFDLRGDLRDAGQVITDWYKDPAATTRYGRTQDLPAHLQAVPGACDSFGSALCDDPLAPGADKRAQKYGTGAGDKRGVPLFGGKLDLTGWLAKKFHVGDVYASRKLKLLDDSRDERAAHGEEFRREQLAKSAELMERNLEALWRATQDRDERRIALFELWDECAEGEGSVGEAGERARAQVIGWIHTHLPKDAYSPAELDALNTRRASTQRFAP